MPWAVSIDAICETRSMINRSALIESPCNNVCIIDPEMQECRGCFRRLDEIANWLQFSDAERQAVIQRVELRRVAQDGSFTLNPSPDRHGWRKCR